MESIKRSNLYNYNRSKKDMIKFSAFLTFINILFYILKLYYREAFNIGIHIHSNNTDYFSIAGLNFLFICFYLLLGYNEKFKERLLLSISFSITRKEFFKSLLKDDLFIIFVISILQSVLLKLDNRVIGLLKLNPIYNFGFINIKLNNLMFIIISIFIIGIFFLSLINLLTALNFSYGSKFWYSFLGIIILILIINNFLRSKGININLFKEIFNLIKIKKPLTILESIKFIVITVFNYYLGGILVKNINFY